LQLIDLVNRILKGQETQQESQELKHRKLKHDRNSISGIQPLVMLSQVHPFIKVRYQGRIAIELEGLNVILVKDRSG
jgi:hypothetical protein